MEETVKPHRDVVATTAVIGCRVENFEGEELGTIKDVALDLELGCIAYAVLARGGVLGVGEKLYAVPWVSLSFRAGDRVFVMKANKDLLMRAPGFDKDRWPDMGDCKWATELHSYFRRPPYWELG